MGKKKIRIIKNDSNKENYTFVSNDSILNNTKNNESINNEIKFYCVCILLPYYGLLLSIIKF